MAKPKGPKPLTNTTDGRGRSKDLAAVIALGATHPFKRAVPAPKPSWVPELPKTKGRKGGRG